MRGSSGEKWPDRQLMRMRASAFSMKLPAHSAGSHDKPV
ncbi:hypothetical protein CPter291_1072 [Collimonas pratensis]|uniref:Uncharacterized protein n=1 Tax=Collimonas pratensis TaxID=279113 RepID=A0ABM5Z2W9_9BURK|nr:hypothetical protein CPter291_1072 [Collimonas pratensis]